LLLRGKDGMGVGPQRPVSYVYSVCIYIYIYIYILIYIDAAVAEGKSAKSLPPLIPGCSGIYKSARLHQGVRY
jgi:hypothetical protein